MALTVLPKADWDLVRNTPAFKSGQKFTVEDVTSLLQATAESYAEVYKGSFSFMLEMQDTFLRRERLSVGQAKGVLNCMAAEIRREDAKKAEPQAEAPKVQGEVPVGYFTVEFEDGEHATLRISKARGQDLKIKAGAFNVATLIGGDFARFGKVEDGEIKLWRSAFIYGDDRRYPVSQRTQEAVKMLLGAADVTAFGLAYARTSGSCWMCGKMLTDPESLDRGIGPECSRKGYQKGKKARAADTQERIALKGGRTYRDIFDGE